MDLGLSQVTVRSVARDRTSADRLFPQVLGVKLVWVAIGLALLAVLAPMLRSDPVVIRLCYALGISSAVRSYLLTARGLLQGLQRFDLEALAVVSDRVLLLVAGGAALWAGYGLFGLAAAFVGSRLVMLGAVQLLLRRVVATRHADLRPQRVARYSVGRAAARLLHDRAQHVHVRRHCYTRPHAHRRRGRLVRSVVSASTKV